MVGPVIAKKHPLASGRGAGVAAGAGANVAGGGLSARGGASAAAGFLSGGGSGEVGMDPAVTMGFAVTIDGHDLGVFTSVDGLSFEMKVKTVTEGGNNSFIHQLPGRVSYTNIKFKRPLNKDSETIIKWFQATLRDVNAGKIKRATMTVKAKNVAGDDIATWNFDGVIPVKWQGPSFSVDANKVAEETLEVAHHGFLET